MGVLPLQFARGRDGAVASGLTGEETYSIIGLAGADDGPAHGHRHASTGPSGDRASSPPTVRIDTPAEADYYRHGGILQYVLRQLLEQ